MTAPAPLRDQIAQKLAAMVPNSDGVLWQYTDQGTGETQPVTIAHLSDVITALVDQREEKREALVAGLSDLHRPWYEVNGVRHEMRVLAGWDEAPKGHVCVVGGDVETCSPDEGHWVLACVECRVAVDYDLPGLQFWPCDTIALLSDADTSALHQHDREVRAGALDGAAEAFATGDWSEAFLAGRVEDDVTAVQATEKWLRDRARAIRGGA